MPSFLPKSIQSLIEEFSRLPGIGPKSAQRLAMHLLHSPQSRISALGDAVNGLKNNLQFCQNCWNIAEASLCKICDNPSRNQQQICVVEEILDVVAIEKTMEYKGVYHVLHGALSPVNGIGPEQLKIEALLERIKNYNVQAELRSENAAHRSENMDVRQHEGLQKPELEIILATNPGLEGETTAMYILRLLKPLGIKITRIARGLPIGGDLDYADELTLTKAMEGRMEYR